MLIASLSSALLFMGVPKPEINVYVLEPDGRGTEINPEIDIEDIDGRSVDLNVDYEILTPRDAFSFNINSSSGIPLEFWEEFLPKGLQGISESLVLCDSQDINALYVYAVVVSEVGRKPSVMGKYNYFNFTLDTKSYQNFETIEDCFEYSINRHASAYFDPDWQSNIPINYSDPPPRGSLDYSDDFVTITEVNRVYAINPNLTINWLWQDSVADIMSSTSKSYLEWLQNNIGGTTYV